MTKMGGKWERATGSGYRSSSSSSRGRSTYLRWVTTTELRDGPKTESNCRRRRWNRSGKSSTEQEEEGGRSRIAPFPTTKRGEANERNNIHSRQRFWGLQSSHRSFLAILLQQWQCWDAFGFCHHHHQRRRRDTLPPTTIFAAQHKKLLAEPASVHVDGDEKL